MSALAVVIFAIAAGAAFASDPTPEPAVTGTSAVLTAGDLNISSAMTPGSFAGKLTGHGLFLFSDASAENAYDHGVAFGDFEINDPRGTGAGWTVTVVAEPLHTADDAHVIAPGSLRMPALEVSKVDAGSSDVPGSLHAAATIDNMTGEPLANTGVEMVTADAGEGMGTYDFRAADTVAGDPYVATPWRLAITADEYAGTYESTVTTTLATALGD